MKRSSFIAWVFCGLVCLAAFLNMITILSNPGPAADVFKLAEDLVLTVLIQVVFVVIGALIISRQPHNLIGWLLFAPAFSQAVSPLLPDVQSWTGIPSQITLIEYLSLWFGGWGWIPLIFPIFLIMLLFPTGRPPSQRWNWVGYLALGMVAVFIFLSTFSNTFVVEGASLEIQNPIGFIPSYMVGPVFLALWGSGLVVVAVASVASLIVRYRQAMPLEREQIKWLLYACALFGGLYVVAVIIILFGNLNHVGTGAYGLLLFLALSSIPVAIAIAILRYRLWDIDVIIRRTLIYGALTATLAIVFFGGVALLQQAFGTLTGTESSPVAIVLSTLAIVALFNPLRRRVQDFIDRRFYRKKYDSEKIVVTFGEGLREQVDLEQLSERLVAVVEETLQPDNASLWLRKGGSKR